MDKVLLQLVRSACMLIQWSDLTEKIKIFTIVSYHLFSSKLNILPIIGISNWWGTLKYCHLVMEPASYFSNHRQFPFHLITIEILYRYQPTVRHHIEICRLHLNCNCE